MFAVKWQRFFRSYSRLFGRNLPTNGSLPVPVINMLRQLYLKGPFTVGIFRKSANARICREVEAQLEEDQDYCLDDVPITVVGSVLKDFLRSLPNCLLDSRLLNKWIEAVSSGSPDDQKNAVEKLLKKLPAENLLLLKHVLCLLWHIAQHSSVNKMCPSNLAVCIGPSLLSSRKIISPVRREEMSKNVPKVISYLIVHCPDLFGESVFSPPFMSHGILQQQPSPTSSCYTQSPAASPSNFSSLTKRFHSISCLPTTGTYTPYVTICPPSYQETMDRKKFVARLHSNAGFFREISFDGIYEQFELRL